MLPEDRIDNTGRQQVQRQNKYSPEQYELAELMLTHGFRVSEVARATRMPVDTVSKLSQGKIMFDIELHMWSEEEE